MNLHSCICKNTANQLKFGQQLLGLTEVLSLTIKSSTGVVVCFLNPIYLKQNIYHHSQRLAT